MNLVSKLTMAALLSAAVAIGSYGQGRGQGGGDSGPVQLLAQASPGQAEGDSDQAAAQRAPEAKKLLGQLAIDKKAFTEIEKLINDGEANVAKARAEIRILQARIARAMLEKNVDLAAIKALVKESLDWELQVRLVQIQRQVELRKILGDLNWETLFKLRALLGQMDRGTRLRFEAKEAESKAGDGLKILGLLKRLE